MANALYNKGRQAFLDGSISWSSDTIKLALVTSSYSPNLSTDQYYSTVSAAVIGTPQTLSSKTSTDGVADAADVTFASVPTGAVTYLVLYKDTGTASTSPLIACMDTETGLPFSTNGGSVTITWDSGSTKIFKL